MKYIKQYESVEEFKIGDYVFVKYVSTLFPEHSQLYRIQKLMDQKDPENWILESLIGDDLVAWPAYRLRKATKKEIKDYMLKIDTNKYNL